jgi:hypothetical protein
VSKIDFRTGTHNPYTIYVTGYPDGGLGGRELAGWMRDTSDGAEWFVGSLPNEALVRVLVEALNAVVCDRCPWGCNECSLDRSDCGCYSHHGDDEGIDTRIPGFNAPASEPFPPAHKALMVETIEHASLTRGGEGRHLREAGDIADDILTILAGQGWRLIHD